MNSMPRFSRKQFLRVSGAAATSILIRPFAFAAPDSSKFYFAVIADTHIIDGYYKGPEGNAEDTESIFKTTERLEAARALIDSLVWKKYSWWVITFIITPRRMWTFTSSTRRGSTGPRR
jgi:hypothetical protein